ncbi:zinc-ribbon domain-containing protein [Yersinia rohdei]|uniref:zinc-ribbon domain-containing protein n=1 Tax=Yersinia rohdei TaxID=29485 RepID=UPI0025AB434E|nr:zinc-ribbon domain-containing protein [Yersinia rohdei]MDN0095069.1 zinc-ribbon domain-containing protein [Yersinia rohdei]
MNKLTEQQLQKIANPGESDIGGTQSQIVTQMATELLTLRKQRVALKVDITCYSCRRFITFQEHAEADGFCPYCDVEIELTLPATK